MDYRDERDALRARNDALEEKLVEKDRRIAALERGAPRRSSAGAVLAIVAALLVGIPAGTFLWLRAHSAPPASAVEDPLASVDPPASPGPPPIPASAILTAPSSAPADANSNLRFSLSAGGLAASPDGVLAVVFEDVRDRRSYSLVALAGADLHERWRAGPFGARAPLLWTAKRRALLVDDDHLAHVIDIDTGLEIASVSGLGDAPARACIHDEQVWLVGVDDKAISLNLATGAGSVGARRLERLCSKPEGPAEICHSLSAPFCRADAPALAGWSARVTLATDGLAVAVGARLPGTPLPILVGFDPTRRLQWHTPLSDDPDLEPLAKHPPIVAALDDELFVVVERRRAGTNRLDAFDAKTGAPRFTYAFPPRVMPPVVAVALGRDRIFATRWGRLHVLDRATGEELAVLGRL